MKEAIANANVFNLIIVFVIILMAFFIGSLSYTKAFKVKNMILNEIEKDECFGPDDSECNYDTKDRVEKFLSEIGYRTKSTVDNRSACSSLSENGELVSISSNYEYCVFKIKTKNGARRYKVIAYMYFDVPVISQLLKIPVNGETVSFVNIEG